MGLGGVKGFSKGVKGSLDELDGVVPHHDLATFDDGISYKIVEILDFLLKIRQH